MTIDDQFAELWAAGETMTDMGLKLGESRGVIAARISRARKDGDARFQPRPPRPKKVREKPTVKSSAAKPVAAAPSSQASHAGAVWGPSTWSMQIPVERRSKRRGGLVAFAPRRRRTGDIAQRMKLRRESTGRARRLGVFHDALRLFFCCSARRR